MGSEQQFCLRWNNHQINMLGVFDQLLQSEALVDVTLACEGLSLKAHKVVLCACSPYFQSLFLENPCKHPIVILKDVKYGDLKALIDFMYRGEVNVSQDQLSALLKTAETLKVKGLAEVTGGINDQVPVSEPGVSNQSTASSPPQPQHAGPPTETSGRSPPAKRKKIRQRRRSGGSADQSDREEDNSRDMQNPLEVLETKVEISDDDYELSRRRLESSEKNIGPSQSAELSLEGPCELNPDPVIPVGVNAAFSVANMELGSSGGSSTTGGSHLPPTSGPTLMSSSSGQHLPPIPPQSLPMLSTQSLPSTSGSQPSQVCQFRDLPSSENAVLWEDVACKMTTWTEEDMVRALSAVQSREMTLSMAANKYGIPRNTLWYRAKRRGKKRCREPVPWTLARAALERAALDVLENKLSIRASSKLNNVPFSTLRQHLKRLAQRQLTPAYNVFLPLNQ